MEKRLREVLQGQAGNYILPFFWQHGEEENTLREYMGKIQESGIQAVCVESRPHPDYVGPGWWRDMDVILKEAEARNMRVWVLDDAHFPTGYCNGQIAAHPEYGKVFLDHYIVDTIGPDEYASFMIRLEEGEELVGVVAVRRQDWHQDGKAALDRAGSVRDGAGTSNDKAKVSQNKAEAVDITSCVRDGIVYWPVPEGYWRVVVLKTVWEGKNCRKDYCNLLDKDAVAFFLDTVYEPHWQHYREKFGNVFAGFFSDEPEFGNTFGEHPNTGIGQPTMLLPWCRELSECCKKAWGGESNLHLAALWNHLEGYTQKARYEYMSMTTDLYGRNFCMQVGKWCEDHGVEYIGHVVEDNGNHARTGYGTGHFFKALWGQHMSGIDVVLQQIRPGLDDMDFCHIGGKNTYDGRFFHYGLGKMGSSLARLDEKKKGRTMCEVYGAYGWTEGLKLMKWLADHMLVRGVNWFVPHAFTPAPFPDPDCPPHFYAQGRNPQFPWFKDLMEYMNRMCHLLNGGESQIRTAVLYTAEMGWMGDHMPFEEVGKWLMRSQIDFDVVPLWLLGESHFTEGSSEGQRQRQRKVCEEGTALQVGNAVYSVLIVPDCAFIPKELAQWVMRAGEAGFRVLFVGERPEVAETGTVTEQEGWEWTEMETEKIPPVQEKTGESEAVEGKEIQEAGETVRYFGGNWKELLDCVEEADVREIRTGSREPWLRYRQYRQPGGMLYLFFNEHPTEQIDTWIEVKELEKKAEPGKGAGLNKGKVYSGKAYWYDGWDNCLYGIEQENRDPQEKIHLQLSPYETRILYLESPDTGAEGEMEWRTGREIDPQARAEAGMGEWLRMDPKVWAESDAGSAAARGKDLELTGEWWISYKEYDQKEFGPVTTQSSLKNISAADQKPEFSGTVRYQTSFDWNPETDGQTALLDCGQVYETLEVWLNGTRQAVRIAPPYKLPLHGLQKGRNDLELLVTNTLVHKMRDFLSMTMPVEASGLLGPVWLKGINGQGQN